MPDPTSLRPRPGETAEQTIERVTVAIREKQEREIHAQAHVLRLLNEAEAVLTGWVLKHSKDEIAKLLDPLYTLCDRDMS